MNGGATSDRKVAAKGRRERRKAKSRDAARQRRGLECTVFDDMLAVLPLPAGCKEQLDKASVVRLTISYIKLRRLVRGIIGCDSELPLHLQLTAAAPSVAGAVLPSSTVVSSAAAVGGTHAATVVAAAAAGSCPTSEVFGLLHCFLLLLSDTGDVVFVTENISKFLGTTQLDLIGNRIFDFLHPCDHDEVKAILHEKPGQKCLFFSRFRCIQQSNGRVMPSKSTGYKVVKFTGHSLCDNVWPAAAKRSHSGDPEAAVSAAEGACRQRHLLLTGELIPNPSTEPLNELADDNTFFSSHALDMKFTACDAKVGKLLRFEGTSLVGSSLYDYVHGCDCRSVEKFFKSLYSKGQSCTERYRFLCNGGGYVWVISKASVVVNRKSSAPQHIECVHTVVSGIEDSRSILSSVQIGSEMPPVSPTGGRASTGSATAAAAPAEGGEYSSIIQDTEALFSELSCRSGANSSGLPSPVAGDTFAGDTFAGDTFAGDSFAGDSLFSNAPVERSDGLDGTSCASVDDDIYACTSGLFQDGTFGDATQTAQMLFGDPTEGLLIDTTCLDEYLEEDMSQRAPYIPMNMASDEVFATSTQPPQLPPMHPVLLHDGLMCDSPVSDAASSPLPPLVYLHSTADRVLPGSWTPPRGPPPAHGLAALDVLRQHGGPDFLQDGCSNSSRSGGQQQRLPETQPLLPTLSSRPWPAHVQPPLMSSGRTDELGQHGWSYATALAAAPCGQQQPPLAHHHHPISHHDLVVLPAAATAGDEPWGLSRYAAAVASAVPTGRMALEHCRQRDCSAAGRQVHSASDGIASAAAWTAAHGLPVGGHLQNQPQLQQSAILSADVAMSARLPAGHHSAAGTAYAPTVVVVGGARAAGGSSWAAPNTGARCSPYADSGSAIGFQRAQVSTTARHAAVAGPAGVKRQSSCPQSDASPRKKRAHSVDILPVQERREPVQLSNTAFSREHSPVQDLWHCSEIWHGGGGVETGRGASRWLMPPLNEQVKKAPVVDRYVGGRSDAVAVAFGLSRSAAPEQRALQLAANSSELAAIAVDDLFSFFH